MADEYNKDSIGTTFSILQKEYEAEENRSKQLETKAQVLLAVSGVLSSALMFLLKTIFELSENKAFDIGLLSASLAFLLLAMLFLLLVFRIEVFEQVKHENLLSDHALHLSDDELKYHLAHDYYKCLNKNSGVGNIKVKRIKLGSYFIVCSIILFAIVFTNFTIGIICKERRIAMTTKNNTGNSGNTTQHPASTPASGTTIAPNRQGNIRDSTYGETSTNKAPAGLGTQPIERGQSGPKK